MWLFRNKVIVTYPEAQDMLQAEKTKVLQNCFNKTGGIKGECFISEVDYYNMTGDVLVEFKRQYPEMRQSPRFIAWTQEGVMKLGTMLGLNVCRAKSTFRTYSNDRALLAEVRQQQDERKRELVEFATTEFQRIATNRAKVIEELHNHEENMKEVANTLKLALDGLDKDREALIRMLRTLK